jgi:hypothetical protein
MDGNVYADTKDGATKNLVSQTTFSVSFQLPALKNTVTRQMFKYLFGGKINEAHILSVKYPSFNGGKDEEYFYLVTYGEINAMGNTILNVGQSLTLMESVEDYELITFSPNLFIYELEIGLSDSSFIEFTGEVYLYNVNTKQFIHPISTDGISFLNIRDFPISVGDKIVCTAPLYNVNGNPPDVSFTRLQ